MKLGFVLVVFLAGAASGSIEKRILGGKSCQKERQYHVQIQSVQPGKSCGGSLLNTRWVITASHCAEQTVKLIIGRNNDVSIFKKAWSFLKGTSKKLEQIIPTGQQFSYKDEEGKAHDIMLIKLSEDVSAKLPTIKLPPVECTKPDVGQQVEVGGWGAKKADSAKIPNSLKCASTNVAPCDEDDKPGASYYSDEETTMCAHNPGVEACFGDAGSAVEHMNVLHGVIVSNPVDKCASSIVITNICHYRQWIDETMKKN